MQDVKLQALADKPDWFLNPRASVQEAQEHLRNVALVLTRRHGIGTALPGPLPPIALADEITRQIELREADGKEIDDECKHGQKILNALATLDGLLQLFERYRYEPEQIDTMARLILTGLELGTYEATRSAVYVLHKSGVLDHAARGEIEKGNKRRAGEGRAKQRKAWHAPAEAEWIRGWCSRDNPTKRTAPYIDRDVYQYLHREMPDIDLPEKVESISRRRRDQKWMDRAQSVRERTEQAQTV